MIPSHMKTYEFLSRMLVVLLAGISPFICISFYGELNSLSAYWRTDLQPLFIFTNALTAYYLYSVKSWKFSGLMLLMLTAFSVELFRSTHDVLAIIFFLANIYPLRKTNHYKWIFWVYITALPVFIFNMLYAEIIAIEAMCLYHGLVLHKIHKLNHEKDLIEKPILKNLRKKEGNKKDERYINHIN